MSAPAESLDDGRPEIRHDDGELPRVLDECESALGTLGGVYVHADRLARVFVTTEPEPGAIRRPARAARIFHVDSPHLTEQLTIAARHLRWDRRIGGYKEINCPMRVATHLLARGDWRTLRPLHGIIEAPIILPTGRIMDAQGYEDGLFLVGVPKGYKRPRNPTLSDAEAARDDLLAVFQTFPLVDDGDKAAAVAAVLSAIVRRGLLTAPLIAWTAPTPGTGKSLANDTVAAIALGRPSAVMATAGDDDAELEKRLYAAFYAGDPFITLDNIERPVGGDVLCQVATQQFIQFRPLGVTSVVQVPTNATLAMTGNNLAIVGDLRRRVMLVRLDAKTDRPERREFRSDAVADALANRGALIQAAITIVAAYLRAGAPHVGLPAFGGFGEWSRMVRNAVVWVGLEDPLKPAEDLIDSDPDADALRAMLSAWDAVFPDQFATVADAITEARRHVPRMDGGSDPVHPALREAIQVVATDRLDSRRLAAWLRRHRHRVMDSMQFEQGRDSHRKTATWRVRNLRSCAELNGLSL